MTKTALITGITGQDGSYLAEFLLAKNYRVVGLIRNKDKNFSPQASHLENQLEYITADLTEPASIRQALETIQPDELYNFASQSLPSKSWHLGMATTQINGLGAHYLFDSVNQIKPDCRVYQASSSEMFGSVQQTPQTENTPFKPMNPYAAAKVYAHHMAQIYRQCYNLFISCGILFNHESPRRGFQFITQKVTYAAACLKLGLTNSPHVDEKGDPIIKNGILSLGNLDAKRDWGFAGDYVEAMWLMLQHDKPDDFIIGTGRSHSIRDLCETAFTYVGLDWQQHIRVDKRLIRPIETGPTMADASKARNQLGWQPKTSFEQLIQMMIQSHMNQLQKIKNSPIVPD